jgi:histone deacetylase complex subunit SAP18
LKIKSTSLTFSFIRPGDYKDAALGTLPANEVQIYTWPDASLREITDLVKDVIVPSSARQKNSSFDISLVYPDRNGDHKMRHVSNV